MKTSKELLAKAGIIPKLRLGAKAAKGGVVSTGAHRVKIIADKIIKKPDPNTGHEIEWVRILLEENGEKRVYDTKMNDKEGKPTYLVQRLAEVPEGSEIILEMKKVGVKNYVEVTVVGASHEVEVSEEDEDTDEGSTIDIE